MRRRSPPWAAQSQGTFPSGSGCAHPGSPPVRFEQNWSNTNDQFQHSGLVAICHVNAEIAAMTLKRPEPTIPPTVADVARMKHSHATKPGAPASPPAHVRRIESAAAKATTKSRR